MRQLTLMPASTPKQPSPVAAPAVPRLRVPKLCVAVQADSPAELLARAQAALADSKFIELRLDSLPKPAAALPKLKEFLAEHKDVIVIATCRRKENGGNFARSLSDELEILA